MINYLSGQIEEAVKTQKSLLKLENDINKIIKIIYKKISKQGKILICGNGGSAAHAQHLVAEFIIRLRPHINRKPISALSLVGDTSTITACSNDYNFNQIFKRNLEATGTTKDILLVISTSGNSKNILEVLKCAKKKNILSIGFLGGQGGEAKKYCDYKLIVDSKNVARIQESHIFLGHYIFEKIEDLIINK